MIERMRGSITVLLALVLVPVLALSNVLLEIGRYRSAKAVLDEAIALSAMSVLGYFDEDLYTRFSLLGMNDKEIDESLFEKYLLDNSNDGLDGISQLYGDIDIDFEMMYSLSNPHVLKNQIKYAEEYRGIVTVVKDREPLEHMDEILKNMLKKGDSDAFQQLECFESTTEFTEDLGKFGEAVADMGDGSKELEEQILTVKTKQGELTSIISEYNASEDSEEDEEDDSGGVTEAEVDEARDSYCQALEKLVKKIDSYISEHDSLVSSINSCEEKLAKVISAYQKKTDKDGGVVAGAVSKGFKAFQEKYETYPEAKNGIKELQQSKTEINKIITKIKNMSVADLASIPEENYMVAVSGNIAYGDWKNLLVTTLGEKFEANIKETLNQLVWVLSYVMPGTDRNNYQFNNVLDGVTYANCFECNPSTEKMLSEEDKAYIQNVINNTQDAAGQLGYDLSRLSSASRTSNLPVMDEMDQLISIIISNMMVVVEFIAEILQIFTTTALMDVFMLAYKLVKVIAKAAKAMVAVIALVQGIIQLVQKLNIFLMYMKQSLAEGAYINTYAASMFPDRTSAISGKSTKGTKYNKYYSPTMTEGEASLIASGLSTGLGAISNDLINTWGGKTPASPQEANMFSGACVEYIVCGNQSEYENQVNVYDRIFMYRIIANLPAFFLNEQAMEVMQIPYVGPIVFLVWYIAECNLDMKFLTLSNEKLPLIKTPSRIFLSENGLKQMAEALEKINSAELISPKTAFKTIISPVRSENDTLKELEKAISCDYTDYCWLLLCMVSNQQKVNRIGDLVEMEMKQKKVDFSLRSTDTCIRADVKVSYNMLLPALLESDYSLQGLEIKSLRFVGY